MVEYEKLIKEFKESIEAVKEKIDAVLKEVDSGHYSLAREIMKVRCGLCE